MNMMVITFGELEKSFTIFLLRIDGLNKKLRKLHFGQQIILMLITPLKKKAQIKENFLLINYLQMSSNVGDKINKREIYQNKKF